MSKKMIWTGRILSGLTGLLLLTGACNMMFVRSAEMLENTARFGYSQESLFPIGAVTLIACVLYLIPRTSVFGAIILTAYLGGAVATHVIAKDSMFPAPVIFATLLWLGVYLRDEKLRAIVPLQR